MCDVSEHFKTYSQPDCQHMVMQRNAFALRTAAVSWWCYAMWLCLCAGNLSEQAPEAHPLSHFLMYVDPAIIHDDHKPLLAALQRGACQDTLARRAVLMILALCDMLLLLCRS